MLAVSESVSHEELDLQLVQFLHDASKTELMFPQSLTAEQKSFIHTRVKLIEPLLLRIKIKFKMRGQGDNRLIKIYNKHGSKVPEIAKLTLDPEMRCRIRKLSNEFPVTEKEKAVLRSCPEKNIDPQLAHSAMRQRNNNEPHVPIKSYNPFPEYRRQLPIHREKHHFLDAIKHNQVIIVEGETGCGKSTQLPQYVLEDCHTHKQPARIFCTQPRRLSAITLAERVALERHENIGQSIGYQIRLDTRVSTHTVLTYCTNGIFLKKLMAGDNMLSGVTHIFMDEVHERDKHSDFLLIVLRDSLPQYKHLKVILMSASADTQIFSSYFNNCPVLTVSGRLFVVENFFLEDVLQMTDWKPEKKGLMIGSAVAMEASEDENKSEQISDHEEQADIDRFIEECFTGGSLDSTVQLYFMYSCEGVDVDRVQTHRERTGLMAAARHGHATVVKDILQLGANRALKDATGKTALDYATEHNHTECVALLTTYIMAEKSAKNPDDLLLDLYLKETSEDYIDHSLMLNVIKYIHVNLTKGSILVFLPGNADILKLRRKIRECTDMKKTKYKILTLHSNMPDSDQMEVFTRLLSARKIILSTNIAETSITIEDVVYVVDSCKVNQNYFESNGAVSSLKCVSTSRACCQQRAGRAGRTKPGKCFHMCSKREFNTNVPLHSVPEILRVSLSDLCLQTKLLLGGNRPIAEFLQKALQPPSYTTVQNTVMLLKTIGALTPMENLTEIGQHLLNLSVEPKLGKMLLFACVMKCLDPILTIVSSLSHKDPFQISMDAEESFKPYKARKELASESFSDHMALLRAFQGWQQACADKTDAAFCAKHVICGATMKMIVAYRSQLLTQLQTLCFVKARSFKDIEDVNLNSEKWHVVKAVLTAGLYPSIAQVDRRTSTLRTTQDFRVTLYQKSTLHNEGSGEKANRKSVSSLPTDWVVFQDICRTGNFCYIRCCTLVTPITVALFSGPIRLCSMALTQPANTLGLSSDLDNIADKNNSSPDTERITLDNLTQFTADASDAKSIFYLREKLWSIIIQTLLNPGKPMTPMDEQILNTVFHVLGAEEKNAGLIQQIGTHQQPKPLTVDLPKCKTTVEEKYRLIDRYYQEYQNILPHCPTGAAYRNGQGTSNWQGPPLNFSSNMLKSPTNRDKPMTFFDQQTLDNVGLIQQSGTDQRPKPLSVDSPKLSMGTDDKCSQYQPQMQYYQRYQPSYPDGAAYRNGQGTSNWQGSPLNFSSNMPKSPTNRDKPMTFFDQQTLDNVGLIQQSGTDQRPKPLSVDSPKLSMGTDDKCSQYQPQMQYYQRYQPSYPDGAAYSNGQGTSNWQGSPLNFSSNMPKSPTNRDKPMTFFDQQTLDNVGLNQQSGTDQRPKPLSVDSPKLSMGTDDKCSQYQPQMQYYQRYQPSYPDGAAYRNGQGTSNWQGLPLNFSSNMPKSPTNRDKPMTFFNQQTLDNVGLIQQSGTVQRLTPLSVYLPNMSMGVDDKYRLYQPQLQYYQWCQPSYPDGAAYRNGQSTSNWQGPPLNFSSNMPKSPTNRDKPMTFFNQQTLDNVGLIQQSGTVQRLTPLSVYLPNMSMGADDKYRLYQPQLQYYQWYQPSYPGTQGSLLNLTSNMPKSPMYPNRTTSLANTENYAEVPDNHGNIVVEADHAMSAREVAHMTGGLPVHSECARDTAEIYSDTYATAAPASVATASIWAPSQVLAAPLHRINSVIPTLRDPYIQRSTNYH